MLGAGDGVPELGAVRGHELHHVWGQPSLQQDLVDGVAGEQGRVTGLPQHHVPLWEENSSSGMTEFSGKASRSGDTSQEFAAFFSYSVFPMFSAHIFIRRSVAYCISH